MTLRPKIIAIVSDIHSNLAALKAVMEDAERRGANDVWCLGDLIGYGPDPNECVALIQSKASRCIIGNHDLGVLGRENLDLFNPYAAVANRWTEGVLSPSARAFLEGLLPMAAWEDVTFAHGSPREPVWEYVTNGSIARESFPHFQTRLCLVGHSHVPLFCPEPAAGEGYGLYQFPKARPLDVSAGKWLINPGSVGQPRDRDPRASYLLFDPAAQVIRHFRVQYDIAATQERLRKEGLPEYLVDRLSQGT